LRKSGHGGGGGRLVYPEGAVEDIINLPHRAYANVGKTLSGTIIPEDPAKEIVWELTDAGNTGATIEAGTFTATAAGTAWIRAKVANGIKSGMDYTKDFSIDVEVQPLYGIEVTVNDIELDDNYTGHLFDPADPSYYPITPIQVDIQNIGVLPTGDINISLTDSNFTVSESSISITESGGTASFTVGPANSLSAGTYNDTVTISGANNINESFSVGFMVTAHPAGDTDTRTISDITVNFHYVPPSYTPFRVDDYETTVTITKGYWMMETEVTQELWLKIFEEDNTSNFTESPEDADDEQLPVDSVSWYAAIAFCNKLSLTHDKTPVYVISGIDDWSGVDFDEIPEETDEEWDAVSINADANGYRLPTEIEWLWAAMGASKGGGDVRQNGWKKDYSGSSEGFDNEGYPLYENRGDYGWDEENADESTHEVGQKSANELGIFDMTGNVREWCWDWDGEWDDAAVEGHLEDDYAGPGSKEESAYDCRMLRGDSYDDSYSLDDRSMSWEPNDSESTIGFRIVCNEETE
jgi:formylglycine-generating enzyme required for sulfatase activity